MTTDNKTPRTFLDSLPALASTLARNVSDIFEPYADMATGLRDQLVADQEILPYPDSPATKPHSVAAIDGARITTNMYAGDMMSAVAMSANGATGTNQLENPSEGWAHICLHAHGTNALAETAMGALEAHILHHAPHQIRLLDGSFRTPLIGMQKALFSGSSAIRSDGAHILATSGWDHFDGLNDLYTYNRTRPIIALPKSSTDTYYASRYASRYNRPFIEQDRVLASIILHPGEMLAPVAITARPMDNTIPRTGPQHIIDAAGSIGAANDRLLSLITAGQLHATYFKPAHATTVIRIEYVTPDADPATVNALGMEYSALVDAEMTSRQPGSLEPYAQWKVDQEAKDAITYMNEVLRGDVIRALSDDQMASFGQLLMQDYRS